MKTEREISVILESNSVSQVAVLYGDLIYLIKDIVIEIENLEK